MARTLILVGISVALLGVLLALFPRAASWFGQLPGDIDVRRGNTRIFVPLGSMIVISLVLTVALNVLGWLLRNLR